MRLTLFLRDKTLLYCLVFASASYFSIVFCSVQKAECRFTPQATFSLEVLRQVASVYTASYMSGARNSSLFVLPLTGMRWQGPVASKREIQIWQ